MSEIRGKDIYQDDGSISGLIEQIEQLISVINQLKDESRSLEQQVRKNNVATKDEQEALQAQAAQVAALEKTIQQQERALAKLETRLKGTTAANTNKRKSLTALERAQKQYEAALSGSNEELLEVRKNTRQLNRITKLQTQLAQAAEGSYEALAAQYGLNSIAINKLSEAERENTEEGRALVEQTRELRTQMIEIRKSIRDTTLQVGDYEIASNSLLASLRDTPGIVGRAANGVDGLGASFRALLANPIGLFITAIVGSFTALFAAFTRTQRGADLFARASAGLQGVMSALIGIVDGLTTNLINLWENPQGALSDFASAVQDNIVNRFNAILELVGALGRGFSALFNRDLAGLRQAFEDTGRAGLQFITGLDTDQQKEFADAVSETTNNIADLTAQFVALETQRRQTIRSNRELQKGVEQLANEEARLQVILDDSTNSFATLREAAEAQAEVSANRARQEIAIARNNLAVINQELALRRSNGEIVEGLLDQQLQAYQAVAQAERDLTTTLGANQRERNQIQQDELERNLDILIDGFDNQKSINERRIKDERLTFDQRREILEETNRFNDESFREQIKTVQEFTNVQVNANDLINESNAVVLNERIRALGLSEVIEGRLLEIIRDRRTANRDLEEAAVELAAAEAKAAAAAEAAAIAAEKAKRESALETFDQQQALSASELELNERTEAQKTRDRLNAERARLQKILEINQEFNGELTKVQVDTISNQIIAIENEIQAIEEPPQNLFDLLGFNIEDDQLQGITSALNFAKQQLTEFLNARVQIAEQITAAAQQETESAEQNLQRQLDLQAQGLANNAETAREELRLAQEAQEEAQREEERVRRQQEAAQAVEQAGNLITASTKIWAQVGNPLIAVPLIALMFGAFAAAKVQAFKATRRNFSDGGVDMIGGGSHASGNDTYIGTDSQGRDKYAEGGEMQAIFSKKAVRNYGTIIPKIVKQMHEGTFDVVARNHSDAKRASNTTVSYSTDMSETNRLLGKMANKQNDTIYTDNNGNRIEVRGTTRRVYKA